MDTAAVPACQPSPTLPASPIKLVSDEITTYSVSAVTIDTRGPPVPPPLEVAQLDGDRPPSPSPLPPPATPGSDDEPLPPLHRCSAESQALGVACTGSDPTGAEPQPTLALGAAAQAQHPDAAAPARSSASGSVFASVPLTPSPGEEKRNSSFGEGRPPQLLLAAPDEDHSASGSAEGAGGVPGSKRSLWHKVVGRSPTLPRRRGPGEPTLHVRSNSGTSMDSSIALPRAADSGASTPISTSGGATGSANGAPAPRSRAMSVTRLLGTLRVSTPRGADSGAPSPPPRLASPASRTGNERAASRNDSGRSSSGGGGGLSPAAARSAGGGGGQSPFSSTTDTDTSTAGGRPTSPPLGSDEPPDAGDSTSTQLWQTQLLTARGGGECAAGRPPPARSGLAGRWRKDVECSDAGAVMEELLDMPRLQRLARSRTSMLEIKESEEQLQLVWRVRLNGGREIAKPETYPKCGGIVEGPRRDGREGRQRGFAAVREGGVSLRCVQGDPYGALFHDRMRLSSRGNRLKVEHRLQLLLHGVEAVTYTTIWHRVHDGEGDVTPRASSGSF